MRQEQQLEGAATVSVGAKTLLFEYQVPHGDAAYFVDKYKGFFDMGVRYEIIHDGHISFIDYLNGDLTNDFVQKLAVEFNLTEQELNELLPSGK